MFADEWVEFARIRKEPRRHGFSGGHRETRLPVEIEGKGPRADTARFIKYRLDRFRSYHFHDTSPTADVKQSSELHDNRFLRANAGNLASFLYMLRSAHPQHYTQVRDTVRLALPGFDDFVTEPSRLNPNTLLLTWRERGSDYEFTAHQLSDGSLRFICLAALLLQPFGHPNAPHAITIDEPELGLHPYAVTLLGSMLKTASKNVQIVVSTQSASLVSAIDQPESVVVVERDGGASTLRRLEPPKVAHWLEDYSLGDLWEKGVIGGRPSP
jgi:predicted ATPase